MCWTLLSALPLLLDLCPLGPAGTSIKEAQRTGRDRRELHATGETEAHTSMQVPVAHWTLCMVLLLAGLPGAEPQPTYQNFLRKHVDHPRTALAAHRYCDTMIRNRTINPPGRPCRTTNTFVHAPVANVLAACNQPPNAAGVHTTPARLSITICRLQGGSTRPPCNYRGQQAQHFVRVNCRNGQPVHLDGTHP